MAETFGIPHPSPSIHEGVMENKNGDQAIATALAAIGECRRGADKARAGATAIHSDDLLTNAARHVKASQFAHSSIRGALGAVDRVSTQLGDTIKALEQKTRTPPAIPSALAMEIRSRLSSMTPAARMKVAMEALGEGEETIASAILSGPPFLSNLDQVQYDAVRQRWAKARFPAELERLAQLRKALDHLQRAGNLSLKFAVQCADQEILAAARRSTERIEAALASAGDRGGGGVH